MKATLIIHGKTGEVCNVIRDKIKPAEGVGQKKEFIHMAVDVPDLSIYEGDDKKTIDVVSQVDAMTLTKVTDKDADIPFIGDKTPIKTIITKKVVAK